MKITIRETPMRAVRHEAFCECGTPLQNTGLTQPGVPVKFVHHCPQCGHRIALDKTYPRIEHVPIDPPPATLPGEEGESN